MSDLLIEAAQDFLRGMAILLMLLAVLAAFAGVVLAALTWPLAGVVVAVAIIAMGFGREARK